MPDSFVRLPADGTGKSLRTYDRGAAGHDQYVIPVSPRSEGFQGRANTFRIPGRAGTTGQKLLTIWNSATSTVQVNVERAHLDLAMTVVKAVTVLPPIIRISRLTAAPTGGTTLAKVSQDTGKTSDAQVTLLQDASADGTSSASALAATIAAGTGLSQEYAPRLITAVGYEVADRLAFFEGEPDVVLRAGQGLCVHLDYTLATQNPVTDMWLLTIDWTEFVP